MTTVVEPVIILNPFKVHQTHPREKRPENKSRGTGEIQLMVRALQQNRQRKGIHVQNLSLLSTGKYRSFYIGILLVLAGV